MPKSKKNIIIFTDWFLPAYKAGGPIQSIANLTNHLKETYAIWVVTSNSDIDEELNIDKTLLNTWVRKEGYQVMYLDIQHQNSNTYKQIFNDVPVHAVYFNSLFSLKFTLIPLWMTKNSPVKKVLAPRGMLGKGALAIKPTKKKVFLKGFKMLNLPNKIEWHATDSSEEQEIITTFGKNMHIQVVPNLSAKMPDHAPVKQKKENALNLFFLSRISIKKNLLLIIEALHKVPKAYSINFKIIGPIEEKHYWTQCLNLLNQLPQHINYEYLGAIPNQELKNTLKNLHVLILPTQHENFGHVIMEAWQNGCPVIISKNTPWQDLEIKKTGFDLDIESHHDFVKAISYFAAMNQDTFDVLSKSSFHFAKDFTENPELITKTKALFQ
ncbi:glycosyltransferase family 4 protein [Pseudotamlana agarivorans]|uniref:glycosyltransferase family 4 protein n=1 Tax=Pseudotamlana agarivorans TaxID=481183 RepID=UPI00083393A1|nr:glycosyltransferase [Tamlana agarivorans]